MYGQMTKLLKLHLSGRLKMEIKLNIQNYDDRNNIVIALANAGIKVYIEKETVLASDTYYVIFEWEESMNGIDKGG
jgi:hypothetical protein